MTQLNYKRKISAKFEHHMCVSYVLPKSYKFKSFTSTSTRLLSTSGSREQKERSYQLIVSNKQVCNQCTVGMLKSFGSLLKSFVLLNNFGMRYSRSKRTTPDRWENRTIRGRKGVWGIGPHICAQTPISAVMDVWIPLRKTSFDNGSLVARHV